MLSFLFGAVAGALAATYWWADLKRFRDDRMPDLRQRAADKVEGAERAIVDTVGRLSKRASSTLRSGRQGPYPGETTAAPGEDTRLG
jgi:hypothetical protein